MLEFFAVTAVLITLNPWIGANLTVIRVGQSLALLRPVSPGEFDYPGWQAALSIGLCSLMTGLCAASQWAQMQDTMASFWSRFLSGFLVASGCFWVAASTLRWWISRPDEDQQTPSVYKVLAAAWLLPGVLGSAIAIAGWPAPMAAITLLAMIRISFHALGCAAQWQPVSRSAAGLALACAAALLVLLAIRIKVLPSIIAW